VHPCRGRCHSLTRTPLSTPSYCNTVRACCVCGHFLPVVRSTAANSKRPTHAHECALGYCTAVSQRVQRGTASQLALASHRTRLSVAWQCGARWDENRLQPCLSTHHHKSRTTHKAPLASTNPRSKPRAGPQLAERGGYEDSASRNGLCLLHCKLHSLVSTAMLAFPQCSLTEHTVQKGGRKGTCQGKHVVVEPQVG
jgi:hypothetical protein